MKSTFNLCKHAFMSIYSVANRISISITQEILSSSFFISYIEEQKSSKNFFFIVNHLAFNSFFLCIASSRLLHSYINVHTLWLFSITPSGKICSDIYDFQIQDYVKTRFRGTRVYVNAILCQLLRNLILEQEQYLTYLLYMP